MEAKLLGTASPAIIAPHASRCSRPVSSLVLRTKLDFSFGLQGTSSTKRSAQSVQATSTPAGYRNSNFSLQLLIITIDLGYLSSRKKIHFSIFASNFIFVTFVVLDQVLCSFMCCSLRLSILFCGTVHENCCISCLIWTLYVLLVQSTV